MAPFINKSHRDFTNNNPQTQSGAISVSEFCRRLSIGKTFFYSEVNAKRISTLKAGRRTLVPVTEVEAYLSRLAEATENQSSEESNHV